MSRRRRRRDVSNQVTGHLNRDPVTGRRVDQGVQNLFIDEWSSWDHTSTDKANDVRSLVEGCCLCRILLSRLLQACPPVPVGTQLGGLRVSRARSIVVPAILPSHIMSVRIMAGKWINTP